MTAKAAMRDEQTVGFEVVQHGLKPMDHAAYLAFAQVGLDQLAAGDTVEESEADRVIAEMLDRHDPSGRSIE